MDTSEKNWLEMPVNDKEQIYIFLFTRYYSTLTQFACHYLSDPQQAEDAVHDVFLNLYLQKGKFSSIVSLKTYLYNSVKNRCFTLLKRRRLQEKYSLQLYQQPNEETHLAVILETEAAEILKKAIDGLQQQTRNVFDLFLLGYNNSEISQKLGITLDSVKAHKKRGKKQLKEKLQNLQILFLE